MGILSIVLTDVALVWQVYALNQKVHLDEEIGLLTAGRVFALWPKVRGLFLFLSSVAQEVVYPDSAL